MLSTNGYANYHMPYGQFMDAVYIPYYETEVEESTFYVRKKTLENIRDRFGHLELREITIAEVMSGNIRIQTAPKTRIQINGNQALKK